MRKARRVLEVDKITGAVVGEYRSACEADDSRGVQRTTTAHQCSARAIPKGRVCWRYADEYDACESYEGRKNRPVAVFIDGKLIGVACDPLTLAERMGEGPCNVHQALHLGHRLQRRYVLRYLDRMGQYKREGGR